MADGMLPGPHTPNGGPQMRSSDRAPETEDVLDILEGYKSESKDARMRRDDKWRDNLDLYWNRYDFRGKARWQSKEVMPEVPAFVDRFAGALKEALTASPRGFYSVQDPLDKEHDVSGAIKDMTDVWLSSCGRTGTGQLMGFSGVFEEQMKLGALMATSALVRWEPTTGKKGRVAVDTIDPRTIWFDPTGRGLYRRRRVEMDMHEVLSMAEGDSDFNPEEVAGLSAQVVQEDATDRAALTGHTGDEQESTNRGTITLDEWYASLVDDNGELALGKSLCIVANDRYLIKGPTPNPMWHKDDWIVYSPLIPTPLSVYGRSYMEDFGSLARTFNKITNLILDAVAASTMNSLVMNPMALIDPTQVQEGDAPRKIWYIDDGYDPRLFAAALETGTLDQASVVIWKEIKNELREAAHQNEVALGQFAPNSRTSATEVVETQQSTSAVIRSIATTVESRFLEPMLNLVWKTGLQNVRADDPTVSAQVGSDMFRALHANRRELIERPITFQARGISSMLDRAKKLRALLQTLQILGQSEILIAAFFKVVRVEKLLEVMLHLFDIDLSDLAASERESIIEGLARDLSTQVQARTEDTPEPDSGTQGQIQQVGDLVNALTGGGQSQ